VSLWLKNVGNADIFMRRIANQCICHGGLGLIWHDVHMQTGNPNNSVKDAPGAFIGAIDVGSNAIRLGIAGQDADGLPKLLQRYREPVRLGHDAFTSGILSEHTMLDAVGAFRRFRHILDKHHVDRYRATATSAMRDASNGAELIQRIADETGIKIDLISGEEEARLVHYSICRRVDLRDQFTLLIDMGGGSVEVTLCDDGEVISAQSFKIGTVRLLEMLGQEDNFNAMLSEYLDGTRKKLAEQIGKRQTDLCIATGGNASAIGELGRALLDLESDSQISSKQLGRLIKRLGKLSFEERISDLGLRPDRADVILPAAMVFQEIMDLGGAKTMVMPDASLLDGLLLDMVDSESVSMQSRRRNLMAWARSLRKKYHVDQQYAETVTSLALSLFDQLISKHGMGNHQRLLLELAARVHEIGMYVRVGGHHRHAAYLISASPLLGLSDREKAVLAQTVRYQRKAPPCSEHEDFMALDKAEQQQVWYLSAILRLALALNKDRRDRVSHVELVDGKQQIALELQGRGDLLLERWAAMKVSSYFEQAFGLPLSIQL